MKTALAAWSVLLLSSIACSAAEAGGERSNGSGSGSGATNGSGATGPLPGVGGTFQGVGGLDITPSGGSGGSTDVANGECNQINFVSSRKPVSVLLVLDRSASMIENEVEPGLNRWDAIVPALTDVITATDSSVHWGLKLYPEGEGEQCTASTIIPDIHIPIAPLNGATVNERIEMTQALGNGTPTGDAVAAAAAYLATLGDDTQKFILLATDGSPSCPSSPEDADRDLAISSVQQAYAAGFPTYVVGVLDDSSGNSDKPTLNSMGIAGGRPPSGSANPLADKFYLASSRDALIETFETITNQVASCVFGFDSAPPDHTNIAVKINDVRIEQSAAEGWEYTSDQHLGIELHGAVCKQVQNAQQSEIDIIFGCPGRPIF